MAIEIHRRREFPVPAAQVGGADVEIDGEKHLILQENDILGVIEK